MASATMRRSRTVASAPDIIISERIERAANLPHVANSMSGALKMFPTRRTNKTVRLQSVDQKLEARLRSIARGLNADCFSVFTPIFVAEPCIPNLPSVSTPTTRASESRRIPANRAGRQRFAHVPSENSMRATRNEIRKRRDFDSCCLDCSTKVYRCNSRAPMSQTFSPLSGRGSPRWSVITWLSS